MEGPRQCDSGLAQGRPLSNCFSTQTSNFYQDLAKGFCEWLVVHERIPKNPLATLRRLNVATDRRHDRRALTETEFSKLIESAENGPSIEGLATKPDLLPHAPLFELKSPGGHPRQTSKMMKLDLERAGIPYMDEEGVRRGLPRESAHDYQ